MTKRHLLVPASLLAALASACGVAQDEACAAYVACQTAYDEAFSLTPTDVAPYEEGGQCWVNEQTGQICRDNCVIALEELRRAARDAGEEIAACQ